MQIDRPMKEWEKIETKKHRKKPTFQLLIKSNVKRFREVADIKHISCRKLKEKEFWDGGMFIVS